MGFMKMHQSRTSHFRNAVLLLLLLLVLLDFPIFAASAQPGLAHYAEFCRFTTSSPPTFLCTPSVNYDVGGIVFGDYYSVHAALPPGRTDMEQFLVDVNGDGRPDYCRFIGDPDPVLTCALRNDTGFTDGALTYRLPGPSPRAMYMWPKELPRFMADVDGDGKADFCFTDSWLGSSSGGSLTCVLQNEGRFGPRGIALITGAVLGRADLPHYMADVNGDGRADFCRFVGQQLLCTLATAEGFEGNVNREGFKGDVKSPYGIDLGHAELGRFMADVDGDGKADFCRFVDVEATTKLSCLLSDGSKFGPGTHESQPLGPDTALGATQGVNPGLPGSPRFMVDINHDGKADFCRIVQNTRGVSFLSCAIATRRGFGNYDVNSTAIAPRMAGVDPFDPGRDNLPGLLATSR